MGGCLRIERIRSSADYQKALFTQPLSDTRVARARDRMYDNQHRMSEARFGELQAYEMDAISYGTDEYIVAFQRAGEMKDYSSRVAHTASAISRRRNRSMRAK